MHCKNNGQKRVNEERGITCHHLNENNKAQKNPLQESWSMNEEWRDELIIEEMKLVNPKMTLNYV